MGKKTTILFLGLVLALFGIIWIRYLYFDPFRNDKMQLGVSFDPEYAGSLKLNPADVFRNITKDWKFKFVRMPIHWNKVEKTPGNFDFSESDYYVGEANKSGVKMMLAIGNKTPRWPECHSPDWSKKLPENEYQNSLRDYIAKTVKQYRYYPALEMWQVENEPFLYFGDCLKLTKEQLKDEIALVRQLDQEHPILVADSGELGFWFTTATVADYFGTTMYRVVWNPFIGYWSYDWVPAAFYRWKLNMVGRVPQKAYVVELQAEPWSPNQALTDVSEGEQSKSMNLSRLKTNIDFAQRVGLGRAYLWGAEWWSWLKANGQNQIPDYIGSLNH